MRERRLESSSGSLENPRTSAGGFNRSAESANSQGPASVDARNEPVQVLPNAFVAEICKRRCAGKKSNRALPTEIPLRSRPPVNETSSSASEPEVATFHGRANPFQLSWTFAEPSARRGCAVGEMPSAAIAVESSARCALAPVRLASKGKPGVQAARAARLT